MIPDTTHIGATLGAIDVQITHSTQGIAVEVDAKRPRDPRETVEESIEQSVTWALMAYDKAVAGLQARGLTPGPFKKAVS